MKTLQRENPELACSQTIWIIQLMIFRNSYVIGDRITDVQLAKNLRCKAIWINNNPDLGGAEVADSLEDLRKVVVVETTDWKDIYEFLKRDNRIVHHVRKTAETEISIRPQLRWIRQSKY